MQLYAVNQETGENEPSITLSDDDAKRIGRGYEYGHSFGIFTDQATGKEFEVKQVNCGAPGCNCAVMVEEV